MSARAQSCTRAGISSSRRACPLGAVSITTRSHACSVTLERIGDADDGGELVDAGRRQIDQPLHHPPVVTRIDPDAAGAAARQPVEQRVDGRGVALPHVPETGGRVDLAHGKVPRPPRDGAGLVRHRRSEHVGQRVRRIGGHEQHAAVRPAGRDRHRRRRRARRLADAALPAEEEQPRLVADEASQRHGLATERLGTPGRGRARPRDQQQNSAPPPARRRSRPAREHRAARHRAPQAAPGAGPAHGASIRRWRAAPARAAHRTIRTGDRVPA